MAENSELRDLLDRIRNEINIKRSVRNTIELFGAVEELLAFMDQPPKIIEVFGSVQCFEAEIEVPFSTAEEIDDFVLKYQEKNKEVLRVGTFKRRYNVYFLFQI